jgi:hypothetical protein
MAHRCHLGDPGLVEGGGEVTMTLTDTQIRSVRVPSGLNQVELRDDGVLSSTLCPQSVSACGLTPTAADG